MKALGFNRNPGEREREIISSWVDDLGCEMNEILEACGKTSGITNPNINYVDKVLRNRRNSETGKIKVSRNVVMEQYEKLREKAREEAEARKQEVYNKILGIREIDVETVEISVQMTQNLMKGNFEKNEDLSKELERLEKERIEPMPFAVSCCNMRSVKCKPAVGAATDPNTLEYVVWYVSLSADFVFLLRYGGMGSSPRYVSI